MKINSVFYERVSQFSNYKGYNSINDFAKNGLGYNASEKLNRLKDEKNKPSFDIIADISNKFEDIDLNWLVTGRGEMLKQAAVNTVIQPVQQQKEERDIPVYELQKVINLGTLLKGQLPPAKHLTLPDLPKCDGAVYMRGDEMMPELHSGDLVVYKQVNNLRMHLGHMCLLALDLGGEETIMICYVEQADDRQQVKLVYSNKRYPPRDVPFDSISAAAVVKASVRYNTVT